MRASIGVKKISENAILPSQAHPGDAGYDLYACIPEPIIIAPRGTVKVATGLSIEIPKEYFGAIFARSGLATKQGLRPANCVGVCDASYRGEYIVALHNDSEHFQVVNPGDRIAQLIILPFLSVDFHEVDELSNTERGKGGFGSTGN